jgi:hypothetical protein
MGRNGVTTTDIDLNTDATTTVFTPSSDATVERIEVPNAGSTAEFDVEVTDGTDTVTLASSGAGGAVSITDPVPLVDGWTLQVDVTTVEGSALTATAVVFIDG